MALPRNLAPPQAPRDDLRPKSRACGPVGLRNAPAGAVQASSPTWVCYNAGPRFPPVGRGPAVGRRGGIYPSRGTLPAANRADMESAPTGVCGDAGPVDSRRAAMLPRPVGRAFTPAAPSKFKTGNVPAAAGCGGMRASRPTAARGRVPFPFGRAFAMVCRGGIYPSRGTLRRREPGGYGIRPYRGLCQREACGFPAGRHVGPGP